MIETFTIYTLAQKPGYLDQIEQLSAESWPVFLRNGNSYHWYVLDELFPDYQLLFCDEAGKLIACGHTVPLIWDGSLADLPGTIDEICVRAEKASQNKQTPNTLSAMAALVSSENRGQNLSSRIVQEMRTLASQHSCTALIAPVRPTWKTRYPLASFERYVEWKRVDGSPFDPWIRVHWRLGATPLCVAPNTLTVEASIKDWEQWTQMVFPDSGMYVVPGALQPVKIDVEHNIGIYEDPNYWMEHRVGES